jgi:hypothetical protein
VIGGPMTVASVLLDGAGEAKAPGPLGLAQAAQLFKQGKPDLAHALLRDGATVLETLRQDGQGSVPRPVEASIVDAAAELGSMASDVIVYDRYFGLRRIAQATAQEQAGYAGNVVVAFARHAAELTLTADVQAALCGFLAVILGEPPTRLPERNANRPSAGGTALSPLEKWKLGHRLYALANRDGAYHLRLFLTALRRGATDAATGHLEDAASSLEAVSASMEVAASMSAEEYCDGVRPTMCPPCLPIELTGAMNSDHRALRTALALVCEAMPEPYHALARKSAGLAAARDALLHLDLSDLERHVTLTLRLVGFVPALDEAGDKAAVQSLRALYLQRLGVYSPLLRHGRQTNT